MPRHDRYRWVLLLSAVIASWVVALARFSELTMHSSSITSCKSILIIVITCYDSSLLAELLSSNGMWFTASSAGRAVLTLLVLPLLLISKWDSLALVSYYVYLDYNTNLSRAFNVCFPCDQQPIGRDPFGRGLRGWNSTPILLPGNPAHLGGIEDAPGSCL